MAQLLYDDQDVGIAMPDGVRLSARIWRPKSSDHTPTPAILEYIPYRKRDGTIGRDSLMHPYVAKAGYACIRVDMRGHGDSHGILHDEYTQTELDDAISIIHWLTQQSWCSGAVGMMGKSWGAFNSLQVAALAPKPLKAIVAVCGTADRYADDIHYKGGCLLGDNFRWGAVMQSFSARPPDPLVYGENWKEDWLKRMQTEPFMAQVWLSHQNRDDYWKHGSICEDYSAIKASVMVVGGFADGYINTIDNVLRNVNSFSTGLIGPWGHQYPHSAAPGPQIGFLQEMIDWWDIWLKDKPLPKNYPKLRVYMQDSMPPARHYNHREGNWLSCQQWPENDQASETFFLTANGLRNSAKECEALGLIDSPADCGLCVGEYFPMATSDSPAIPELAGDQREDDAKSLCFDTPPLKEPLSILGRSELKLTLSSDASEAQLFARLCDVAPNGASTKIGYGFLNLCMREGFEKPKPLVPDKPETISLSLDLCGYRLKKGHRLRLALSNQYWPFVWPNPKRCSLRLFSGVLMLPCIKHRPNEETAFLEVETSTPHETLNHRTGYYNRTISKDLASGEVVMKINTDEGRNEDVEHGLINDCTIEEVWRIHPDDPLCARVDNTWKRTIERQGWQVRIDSHAHMHSDEENFYLTGTIKAWHQEELVFEKNRAFTIPRDHR